MTEALEVHERLGIQSDELNLLKQGFKLWSIDNTSAVRSNATAMRKPAKKRTAEDFERTKEGKFKRKSLKTALPQFVHGFLPIAGTGS